VCAIALLAIWLAMRRPESPRLQRTLDEIDGRLAGLDARIGAALRSDDLPLGWSIVQTLDLPEVLQRTLSATEAIEGVDGSRVSVVRADGTTVTETRGPTDAGLTLGGPPDGASYGHGLVSWKVTDPDALSSGLVVPLGGGSLSVYSRRANAFDAEAIDVLAAIASRAAPAVQNAFRYLDVQRLAATDSRTGLGSASAFDEALPRELSAARRHGRPLCLIQIDLDDFGKINKATKTLDAGNLILEEFGVRARATIRGSDAGFRNSEGADEFFLILPETTRAEATQLYRRLEFEMAAPPLGGYAPPVTMSSGLAEIRADDTADSLRRRAGIAQGIAKSSGKNQLVADDDPRMPPE
jgi:diguanylate cyclase (GGDEF)-like protein